MSEQPEVIHTRIWEEIAEPDNPFAAAVCRCAGYDVYGDLLGRISWIEYLYLLFRQDPPTREQAKLLEGLAVAIANPGPRDPGVHAAMSAGVGGSTHASCLMAALAVGAGQLGGAHEVALAMEGWRNCGTNLNTWREFYSTLAREERSGLWPKPQHLPGFDPYGASCPRPVLQTLAFLATELSNRTLAWLQAHRLELESIAGCPLAMTGVAAATMVDLNFAPEEGEMLYLLLRLPGAAAHALEQRENGWRLFPFFSGALKLESEPTENSLSGAEKQK
jgi:citrate synthase